MNRPDIPKINEGIARKFHKIEASLALPRSAAELFQTLLANIHREFGIPFVWLSLIRMPETTELRKSLEASPLLRDRLNIIEQAPFLEVVPDGATPLLARGDLRPFFRLLPSNRKYFIRSVAISPLTCQGRLIGSLNQGDSSLTRYDPGMDTTLLMHLAQNISGCLSHLLAAEEHFLHPAPLRG